MPSLPRSALHARCVVEILETAFFDVEKHPQVIQLPLRLDGLACQLVKLVYIKWLRRRTCGHRACDLHRGHESRLCVHEIEQQPVEPRLVCEFLLRHETERSVLVN